MDPRNLLMHQAMLGDRVRLDAYAAALADTVRPGDVVIDVGAGTLALTLLALRAGAGHVYAVEADPQLVAAAAEVVHANRLQDRVTLVPGDARRVRLDHRADVIVSELMGNLGPEEEMTELVEAVAAAHLKPGGAVIPRDVASYLVPAELDGEGWAVWDSDYFGFRLDAVAELAGASAQLHFFQRPVQRLGRACRVTPRRDAPDSVHELPITTSGRLHAILGYFEADLAPGVTLSNFPSYPGCNWAVWVWPLRHTSVRSGDRLSVRLRPSRRDFRDVMDWRLDCGVAAPASRS